MKFQKRFHLLERGITVKFVRLVGEDQITTTLLIEYLLQFAFKSTSETQSGVPDLPVALHSHYHHQLYTQHHGQRRRARTGSGSSRSMVRIGQHYNRASSDEMKRPNRRGKNVNNGVLSKRFT